MYEINNLAFSISKKEILKNINLEIKPNNFLCIVGSNGSGKSTLLKIINRNLNMYTGSVKLDNLGIEEYTYQQLALKRAVLNQSYHFPYSFKAIEIVQMGLYAYNLSKSEENKILNNLINKLGIELLINKDYQILSGGEKQKIQFARVICQIFASKEKERYLFLDEPTLNLDIYYQLKILDLIKELISELNIGVCAVLHDINQVYNYSDEVAMLQDGSIKYFGNTKDILTQENIYDIFKIKSDFVYSKKLDDTILVLSSR